MTALSIGSCSLCFSEVHLVIIVIQKHFEDLCQQYLEQTITHGFATFRRWSDSFLFLTKVWVEVVRSVTSDLSSVS